MATFSLCSLFHKLSFYTCKPIKTQVKYFYNYNVGIKRSSDPYDVTRRSFMKKFMLLHGVNHNMFGKRDPRQYGTVTLNEINEKVLSLARELGVTVTCFQTNDEGKMVDKIHEAYLEHYDGVLINAGAWTHYSYAISDALEMLECPIIELHMSNVHKREEFRHHSVISPIADGIIIGLGADVYTLGLRALADKTSGTVTENL